VERAITAIELPAEIATPLPTSVPATPPPGRLPPPPAERDVDRRTYGALAAAIVLVFFVAAWFYWVPAHPGTDQNGYLVGGKLFAHTGSTGFRPDDPYSFVGRMWVQTADGRCFPKYPLGLSVVYGVLLKLGGRWGVPLCFGVNPAAMSAALVATFGLVRRVAGSSFAGVLGLLVVATSPVCVGLTDNPNSHATALCCVAWGMWLLLEWWQAYGLWRAIGAGLLLGSAVTIRYTEGLLLLPIAAVAVLNLRRDRRPWLEAVALGLAWAVPVGLLAAYNLHSMHTLTGYDPTNESTGFAWANFAVNWDTMLRELNTTGLLFTLPFAVLGGVAMWRRDWRTSLLLALWAVPNLVLYTAYYWAPNDPSTISYLRFTLTVFPALAAAAVLGMTWLTDTGGPLATVAVGVVVAVGCGAGLYTALDNVTVEAATNRAVLRGAQTVIGVAPTGSVVFGPDRLLNYLQLAGDYRLYDTQQFNRQAIQLLGTIDPNAPTGLQPQRAEAIYAAHRDESDAQLMAHEARLVTDALAAGRRVFVVEASTAGGRSGGVARLVARGRFTARVVGGWDETPEERVRAKRRAAAVGNGRAANRAGEGMVTWQVVELRPPTPLALPSRRGRHRPSPP
jgi:hypothetical protein